MDLKTYNEKQEVVYIKVDFFSFMKFYLAAYGFIALVSVFFLCCFVILGMALGN